jgi:hypothetical protein
MQAEAIADAFRDASSEAELATKQDIAELKRDIKDLAMALRHDLREREIAHDDPARSHVGGRSGRGGDAKVVLSGSV